MVVQKSSVEKNRNESERASYCVAWAVGVSGRGLRHHPQLRGARKLWLPTFKAALGFFVSRKCQF